MSACGGRRAVRCRAHARSIPHARTAPTPHLPGAGRLQLGAQGVRALARLSQRRFVRRPLRLQLPPQVRHLCPRLRQLSGRGARGGDLALGTCALKQQRVALGGRRCAAAVASLARQLLESRRLCRELRVGKGLLQASRGAAPAIPNLCASCIQILLHGAERSVPMFLERSQLPNNCRLLIFRHSEGVFGILRHCLPVAKLHKRT